MRRLLALCVVVSTGCHRAPAGPTFSHDVAPIVFSQCTSCHHPGGAGPFSLMTYEDVAKRSSQIARITASHTMPPWKAVGSAVHYRNERVLTDTQIALLATWDQAGAPVGEREKIPAAPSYPPPGDDAWVLGAPDLVVTLPSYTLGADGTGDGNDVYRNFVVPAPLAKLGSRWIRAWEFHAGTRVIHHAIVNLDRSGWARAQELALRNSDKTKPSPEPAGFPGMEPGTVQAPDGYYLVWTPGQVPTPPQPGMAWALDGDADLVVQLHLQPSGKAETIAPQLALYFADGPPTETRVTLRIGDMPIDIEPGDPRYTVGDSFTLPVPVKVLSLFPHAHFLGKTMRVFTVSPDQHSRGLLLAIDHWDPAWQDEYVLAEPPTLPAGTRIAMQFDYDNSERNPRNPHKPPVEVKTGERTVDEMGNVTLSLLLPNPADKAAFREAKYRRILQRSGNGASDARNHFNLANALAEEKKSPEAIAEYREALALDGTLWPAHLNLGHEWLAANQLPEAAKEFAAASARAPAHATAPLIGWGLALLAQHDANGAAQKFAAALDRNPNDADAQLHLGRALTQKGDRVAAKSHLDRALELRPKWPPALQAERELGN